MHLKSCQPLVRSELRVDSSQQGALRSCSSNRGNVISSRLPLTVISTNTLRRSNSTNTAISSVSLRLKAPPPATLHLLPSPPFCENDTLRLYQSGEDLDGPLDIWTVIKPGHVREKIAIFASDSEQTEGAGSRECSSTPPPPPPCTSHGAMTGPIRPGKAKGSWDENCNAKRRRRSGANQNLLQDQRTWLVESQQSKLSPRRPDGGKRGGETAPEEEEQKVSVVEMVAFLEQRASEQQPDSKPPPTIQRSCTTITLARAPPPEREGSEVRGEEPDSVKVSDMVARLESECLRRSGGDLSRSNSLRRAGRVLLAAGDQSPAPPTSPPSTTSTLARAGRKPAVAPPPSSALATPPSGEFLVVRGAKGQITKTVALPPQPEEAEPVPGLLFLSPASEPRPLRRRSVPPEPRPPPARCDSSSQSDKRRRRRRGQEEAVEAGRRASHDFLLLRQKVQQLLEPQPYLSLLPHHLLLKILLLLPTRSLAALKCCCHYFNFIIDTYGVRPADSLWVSDPRYRDDPCKQCKKRFCRGDVSLCRWHHKPYCQALPYGPGYWMCCHGAHRDTPGCNVGLHDNRWVPAFHSINAPIYRRSRNDD